MVEGAARLLTRHRGKWVKKRSIAALHYYIPEKAPQDISEQFVHECRKHYDMVVEEKIFPEGIRHRWNGKYRGTIDDRRMTDEMYASDPLRLVSSVGL